MGVKAPLEARKQVLPRYFKWRQICFDKLFCVVCLFSLQHRKDAVGKRIPIRLAQSRGKHVLAATKKPSGSASQSVFPTGKRCECVLHKREILSKAKGIAGKHLNER